MTRIVFSILISFNFITGASAAAVDGINIHWISEGRGSAIVFVHGWTCDTSVWKEQMAEFKGDYRVIALDLPGHGQSGSPSDGKFTMDLYARAVEAVRTEAGIEKMVLVGHSMGGPVIGQYAISHPNRVAGLVGVDAGFRPRREPPPGFDPDNPPPREKFIRSMFVPETSEAVQKKVLDMMLSTSDKTAMALGSAMGTFTSDTGVTIDAPSLIVFAGTRKETGVEALREFVPRVKVEKLNGTGHFLMMEKPVEFNMLLRNFLTEIKF